MLCCRVAAGSNFPGRSSHGLGDGEERKSTPLASRQGRSFACPLSFLFPPRPRPSPCFSYLRSHLSAPLLPRYVPISVLSLGRWRHVDRQDDWLHCGSFYQRQRHQAVRPLLLLLQVSCLRSNSFFFLKNLSQSAKRTHGPHGARHTTADGRTGSLQTSIRARTSLYPLLTFYPCCFLCSLPPHLLADVWHPWNRALSDERRVVSRETLD